MKTEKMKVLLYLKKSGKDKQGKAPIMGRITLGRSIVQFSCKLSCDIDLWSPRESRMRGKSREAVEVWKSHTNLTHPGKYFRPSKVKIMRPTSPK